MQKLHCYVDESGQDPLSDFFIVVAVVSEGDQQTIREALLDIELSTRVGAVKWHKSNHERRLKYLHSVTQQRICRGELWFGRFKKPLPFFFPILGTIKKAIEQKAHVPYQSTVFIDGIDKKKAAEMTNALRVDGIRVSMIRGRRDENEPFIRLADRWAGCIRDAFLGGQESKGLLRQGLASEYLIEITK